MHQPLLLLLLLAAYTVGGVRSSSVQGRSGSKAQDVVEWPGTGISLCQKLQEPNYRQDCIECFNEAVNTIEKVKACVKTWLPRVIAKCTISAQANSIDVFNNCIASQKIIFDQINKRAELLYKKGSAVLKKVTDLKTLKDGPSAIFSIMAQELLFSTDPLKSILNAPENDCFTRFQVDPANELWHIHPNKRPQSDTNTNKNIQAFQKTKTTEHQLGEETNAQNSWILIMVWESDKDSLWELTYVSYLARKREMKLLE